MLFFIFFHEAFLEKIKNLVKLKESQSPRRKKMQKKMVKSMEFRRVWLIIDS